MASCLDELQWLSKSKLDLKPEAKVSIFLEKDGTEVDDQKYFEKLTEHTGFVAKEDPLNNDVDTKKIAKYQKTEMGLKITGYNNSHEGVYISDIKPYDGAYYLRHDQRSNVNLEIGQQIKSINGKSLDGKSYLDIVEIIRDTRDFYTLNLLVADVGQDSRKSSGNNFCCSLM